MQRFYGDAATVMSGAAFTHPKLIRVEGYASLLSLSSCRRFGQPMSVPRKPKRYLEGGLPMVGSKGYPITKFSALFNDNFLNRIHTIIPNLQAPRYPLFWNSKMPSENDDAFNNVYKFIPLLVHSPPRRGN